MPLLEEEINSSLLVIFATLEAKIERNMLVVCDLELTVKMFILLLGIMMIEKFVKSFLNVLINICSMLMGSKYLRIITHAGHGTKDCMDHGCYMDMFMELTVQKISMECLWIKKIR